MNSDTPDYSIKGAAKSHSSPHSNSASLSSREVAGYAQPASRSQSTDPADSAVRDVKAAAPQKLSKVPKEGKDARRNRDNSIGDVLQQGTNSMTTNAKPELKPSPFLKEKDDVSRAAVNGNSQASAQRKALAPPMDSPTLGYSKSEESGFGGFQTSSDSGYGSTAPSTFTKSQTPSERHAVREAQSSRMPRIDSAFEPKMDSQRELAPRREPAPQPQAPHQRPLREGKSLVSSSLMDPREKRDSNSSIYVSRLDPGPTRSIFAASPGPESNASKEQTNDRSIKPSPHTQPGQNEQHWQDIETRERGRSTTKAPTQPLGSPKPKEKRPKDFTQQSTNSQIRPIPDRTSPVMLLGKYEIAQPSYQQPTRASTPPPVKSPGVNTSREITPRTYTLPSPKPQDTKYPRETPKMGQYTSKPSSNKPQLELSSLSSTSQEKSEASERQSTPPTTASNLSTPRNAVFDNEASPPKAHRSVQALAKHSHSESRASYASDRSSVLPPLFVLEGFKVNRRGQVLDEEGDVVGELFEGDIIDCVRQKVNAHGDVVDEFGTPVGRVRPVPRGYIPSGRLSISSTAGINHPSGPFPWARRGSTASQQVQSPYVQSPRESLPPVSPPPVAGNAVVAELDASTEAEAAPTVDHSEIFSPFGTLRGNKRSESPTTYVRRSSQPTVPNKDRETSIGPKPRKWSSRYFEDGPGAPRRSSLNPETSRSPTRSVESPTHMLATSAFPGGSRAIIGPTLESLLEQSSELFSSKDDLSKAGGSTPNLPFSQSRASTWDASPASDPAKSALPRPASFANGGAGLAPASSVRSGLGHHQPLRRSPLGNYGKYTQPLRVLSSISNSFTETTPPGSGVDNSENGQIRCKSQPAAPRTFIGKSGKVTVEMDDAAPAPEIPMATIRGKRADPNPVNAAKTLDKKKSRFSFMLGKKEQTATM